MAGEDHLLGVRAGPPPPRGRLDVPPLPLPAPPPQERPAWPPAAQWSVAGLAAVLLALLAWRGWGLSRYCARPLPLERAAAIDLNEADEIDLQQLPGVGPGLARRIVEHRRRHGPFASVEELRRVRGIGPATLERLRQHLSVEETYEDEPPPPPRVVRARAAEGPGPPAAVTGKKKPPDAPIDVNRAPPEELMRLPGIGPKLAAGIVEARRQRPFASVEELRRVRGIGAKTMKRLRPHVVAGAE